jgi:hypothetical protein
MPLATVSIATCVYQRYEFLDKLMSYVITQDYPHHLIEWRILDDSPLKSTLFDALPHMAEGEPSAPTPYDLNGIAVYYYYLHRKIPLGVKRNMLSKFCQKDYTLIMDDDDYQHPSRLSHSLTQMQANPRFEIGGVDQMYLYFIASGTCYQVAPHGVNHATAATFIYTRNYGRTHKFSESDTAEETSFTNDWTEPILQLDPKKTLVALCHSKNTVDKTKFLNTPRLIKTDLKLEDFKELKS